MGNNVPYKFITSDFYNERFSPVFPHYIIFRSPPGLSPLHIIIMKSKSVGCHFIMIYYVFVIIITCILIDCFIRMNNFAELSIGCVLIIINNNNYIIMIFPGVSPVFPRCL